MQSADTTTSGSKSSTNANVETITLEDSTIGILDTSSTLSHAHHKHRRQFPESSTITHALHSIAHGGDDVPDNDEQAMEREWSVALRAIPLHCILHAVRHNRLPALRFMAKFFRAHLGDATTPDAESEYRRLWTSVEQDENATPSHLAAALGHVDVLRFLCEEVQDENAVLEASLNGKTVAQVAAENGQDEVLAFLGSKKVGVSSRDQLEEEKMLVK